VLNDEAKEAVKNDPPVSDPNVLKTRQKKRSRMTPPRFRTINVLNDDAKTITAKYLTCDEASNRKCMTKPDDDLQKKII
jgi:hypothetical protein